MFNFVQVNVFQPCSLTGYSKALCTSFAIAVWILYCKHQLVQNYSSVYCQCLYHQSILHVHVLLLLFLITSSAIFGYVMNSSSTWSCWLRSTCKQPNNSCFCFSVMCSKTTSGSRVTKICEFSLIYVNCFTQESKVPLHCAVTLCTCKEHRKH